jgi:hypothetical protein
MEGLRRFWLNGPKSYGSDCSGVDGPFFALSALCAELRDVGVDAQVHLRGRLTVRGNFAESFVVFLRDLLLSEQRSPLRCTIRLRARFSRQQRLQLLTFSSHRLSLPIGLWRTREAWSRCPTGTRNNWSSCPPLLEEQREDSVHVYRRDDEGEHGRLCILRLQSTCAWHPFCHRRPPGPLRVLPGRQLILPKKYGWGRECIALLSRGSSTMAASLWVCPEHLSAGFMRHLM